VVDIRQAGQNRRSGDDREHQISSEDGGGSEGRQAARLILWNSRAAEGT